MAKTLEQIRDEREAELAALLKRLDDRHRLLLRDAIRRYGSVRDIPESVWDDIRNDYLEQVDDENRTAAAILLLLMMDSDGFSVAEIESQGVRGVGITPTQLTGYSRDSAAQVDRIARQVVDTTRRRITRKVQDKALGPSGGLGTVTDEGIEEALNEVLTADRREAIAIDLSTGASTTGQRGAADRIEAAGGDGASASDRPFTIDSLWITEGDNIVCPRCAPLHMQTEEVWGRVFPEGPGDDAHSRCRCKLRHVVRFLTRAA